MNIGEMVKYSPVVVMSASLSSLGYYLGAKGVVYVTKKLASKEKQWTAQELGPLIFSGGALLGNYTTWMIRDFAREKFLSDPQFKPHLEAACLGTLVGSIFPMVVCLGGYDKKETRETSLVATLALVSTFVLNVSAFIQPQEQEGVLHLTTRLARYLFKV